MHEAKERRENKSGESGFNPADRDELGSALVKRNELVGDRFDSLGVFLSLMRSLREAKSLLASFSARQVRTMETRHQ